jgi:hypothetical protein
MKSRYLRLLFSILIFVFLLEAGSAWYCWRKGIGVEVIDQVARQQRPESSIVPHPYLGFTRANRAAAISVPEGILPVPNATLVDFNENLSRARRPKNVFVIAILGNSVAERMFVNSGQYLGELAKTLREKVPELRNKKIEFLNMALFAYVQPQHFISSALYADLFDMAILLGGFNSVVHPLIPDRPLIFPLVQPEIYMGSGGARLYSWLLGREILRELAASYHDSPLRHSSAFLLAVRALAPVFSGKFETTSQVGFPDSEDPFSKNRAEQRVEIWSDLIVAQYGALKALGKPIWFFVQPNLHVPGSKPFTDDEKNLIRQGTGFALGAKYGYPAMREASARLHALGLPIYDLTNVFSGTKERVYEDSCCHLQNAGVKIVLERISEIIVRDWAKNRAVSHLDISQASPLE